MIRVGLVLLSLLMAQPAFAEESKRVVSIGGALTEIVYALGASEYLVGSDTTSYYPEAATKLQKVGYQRALSAEGIVSLTPDVILLTEEAGPPPVIHQLHAAKVEILQLKAARSMDDVYANIKAIGQALGRTDAATTLIESMQTQHKTLQETIAKATNAPRVMFILQHGGGAPMVAGKDTAADSIIGLSGGKNVVDSYEGYRPLTPEAAVSLSPEVLLVTQESLEQAGGREALLASTGVSLTPAAKNGRLIVMDSLLLLGFGPRTIEAATQLNGAYGHAH